VGAGLLALGLLSAAGSAARNPSHRLVFESTALEREAVPGAPAIPFVFRFTNTTPESVTVEWVRASCGCTFVEVPDLPWVLPAGDVGQFTVVMDGRGRRGTLKKSVQMQTTLGRRKLSVEAHLTAAPGSEGEGTGGRGEMGEAGMAMGEQALDERERNQRLAMVDRFAVFRGACASCHVAPTVGRTGPSLYVAACGICHDSENRASMVPDLKSLPHPTDRAYWARWIQKGGEGTLMPGFAETEGGPLTASQVESLVEYLSRPRLGTGRDGDDDEDE
jgi:mono/diheme cytochrome c family protein